VVDCAPTPLPITATFATLTVLENVQVPPREERDVHPVLADRAPIIEKGELEVEAPSSEARRRRVAGPRPICQNPHRPRAVVGHTRGADRRSRGRGAGVARRPRSRPP
jgi:hypothetical protein